MKKQDIPFWMLIISFIFGVSLNWPLWARFVTILLSGSVLLEIFQKVYDAYKSKM